MDVQQGALGPPPGWYPDPGGAAQWRHWGGTTWSTSTMPYAPPAPDAWAVAEDRRAWQFLRAIAPWGLVAPAFGAAAYAADSSTFGPLRRWLHAAVSAMEHGRTVPPMPTTKQSTVVAITFYAVWFVSIVGVGAWLRYTLASMRLCAKAGYPSRHRPVWACLGFLVPFLGPLVAWSASKEWLPVGHEARRVLGVGWALVGLGEVAVAALWLTGVLSSSLAAAWAVAAVCAVVWVAAAMELPRGLEAIADDHASLGVRAAAGAS